MIGDNNNSRHLLFLLPKKIPHSSGNSTFFLTWWKILIKGRKLTQVYPTRQSSKFAVILGKGKISTRISSWEDGESPRLLRAASERPTYK